MEGSRTHQRPYMKYISSGFGIVKEMYTSNTFATILCSRLSTESCCTVLRISIVWHRKKNHESHAKYYVLAKTVTK